MKKKYKLYILVALALVFMQPDTTYAADTTLAWDSVLDTLKTNIVQSVVPAIATIMIAVAALMVVFGEQHQYKSSFYTILGLGLALNFGSFLYSDSGFGSYLNPTTQTAQTTMYKVTLTDTGDVNFLSGFMNNYINHIVAPGAEAIKGPSLKLLGTLALIDVSVELALGLGKTDVVKFMLELLLKIGFYIFLITNWVGGTFGLTEVVSASFEKLGYRAAGGTLYNPDSIVQNGIKIFNTMWASMSKLGISSFGVLLADFFILITVTITTFLTAIEMFMIRIEFWTIALITLPLLAFGINKHTRFLAEKAIGAVFNCGIKCGVIAFISAVAGPLLNNFAEQIAKSPDVGTSFNLLLQLMLGCIVIYMLTTKIPALAQGLISGSPSLSSGDMRASIGSAAAGASKVGAVYGAARMASNMQGGATALKAAGVTGDAYGGGPGGSLKALAIRSAGTGRNLMGIAASAANERLNPLSSGSRSAQDSIKNRHEKARD